MKKHIEAEKGELIIVSDEGHRAIIPAKDRKYFLDSLNGCDDCINKYIQQLPMMSNYAEDGSLVPDDGDPIKKETYEQWGDRIRKIAPNLDYTKDGDYNYRGAYEAGLEPVEVDNNGVKEYHLGSRNPKTGEILKYRSHPTFNQAISEDVKMGYVPYEKDGRIYTVDRKSKEYKDLYDSGKLLGYDRVNDLYIAPDLGGATIKATKPQWMKDKEALEKEYSKDWYINNNLPKFSRSIGVSADNMGGNQKGYDEYINNKLAKSILDRNPYLGTDKRPQWLDKMSQAEKDIISKSKYNSELEPTGLQKFENMALGMNTAGYQGRSVGTTVQEAKEHQANPLNALEPLNIIPKTAQSLYKDRYSLSDGLQARPNNAGVIEDIITDFTTYAPLLEFAIANVKMLGKGNKLFNFFKSPEIKLNIDYNQFSASDRRIYIDDYLYNKRENKKRNRLINKILDLNDPQGILTDRSHNDIAHKVRNELLNQNPNASFNEKARIDEIFNKIKSGELYSKNKLGRYDISLNNEDDLYFKDLSPFKKLITGNKSNTLGVNSISKNPNFMTPGLKSDLLKIKNKISDTNKTINVNKNLIFQDEEKIEELLKYLEDDKFKLLAEYENYGGDSGFENKMDNIINLLNSKSEKFKFVNQKVKIPELKDPIEEGKYKLLQNILGDQLDNYVYFKEFDGSSKMFYSDPKYKTFSDLIADINKGNFKLSDEGVTAYKNFFNEAIKRYPDSIPYGSSKIIEDLNTLPGDIDLGRAGPGTSKFIYDGDRKITDLNYPEVLHQHYAYNHPELYEKLQREAVEESLKTGRIVTPKFDKIKNEDFNPQINTLMDMFMSTKKKHVSRTGVYLGNTKDLSGAKKAIETKKRLLTSSSEWGAPNVDLSDFTSNTRYLKSLGYSDEMIKKINSDPERLQLIFENDYVNRVTATRRIAPYESEDMTSLEKVFFNNKGSGLRAYGEGIYAGINQSGHAYGNLSTSFRMEPALKLNKPEDILNMEFKNIDSVTDDIKVIRETDEPYNKGVISNPTFRSGDERSVFESRGNNNEIINPQIPITKNKTHIVTTYPESYSSTQMKDRYKEYYNKLIELAKHNPRELKQSFDNAKHEIIDLENKILKLRNNELNTQAHIHELKKLENKYERAIQDRKILSDVLKVSGVVIGGVGLNEHISNIKESESNKSPEQIKQSEKRKSLRSKKK